MKTYDLVKKIEGQQDWQAKVVNTAYSLDEAKQMLQDEWFELTANRNEIGNIDGISDDGMELRFDNYTIEISLNLEETLKDFALDNDYAFCLNAGIQYANDQDVREDVAEIIEKADDIEPSDIADLADEAANGCTIYKVSGNDIDTLYIAYYE